MNTDLNVQLFNMLTSLQQSDIDKNVAVISFEKNIMDVSKYTDSIKPLQEAGFKLPSLEECKTKLKDRIIQLKLPLPRDNQPITISHIEKHIWIKFIAEYKQQGYTKDEITVAMNTVLDENKQQLDFETFNVLVTTKLEEIKKNKIAQTAKAIKIKNADNNSSKDDLLVEIFMQIVKIANINKQFILSNDEISNYENLNITQLKQLAQRLKDINESLYISSSNLQQQYNKDFTTKAKLNISSNDLEQNIYRLTSLGCPLKVAYETIKDLAKEAVNKTGLNQSIEKIIHLYNNNITQLNSKYHQLDKSKIQLTYFQFIEAYNYLYYNAHEVKNSIKMIEETLKNSNTFKDFYDTIYQSTASKYTQNTSFISLQQASSINSLDFEEISLEDPLGLDHKPISKDISFSPMLNYSNTCWINASLKFMYTFYGKEYLNQAIDNKINEGSSSENANLKEKQIVILREFQEIINSLEKNEPINIRIVQLLQAIYEYAQVVPENKQHNDDIMCIYNKIKECFSITDEKLNINPGKIMQQDVIQDFIDPFICLLNLKDTMITKKSIKTYTYEPQDLKKIGLEPTKEKIILELEPRLSKEFPVKMITETTNDFEDLNESKLEYYTDYLTRSNIDQAKKQNLLNDILDKKLDSKLILPTKVQKQEALFIKNIQDFSQFIIDTNYGNFENGVNVRDIDKVKQQLHEILPTIKLTVIDEKTNKSYIVEAKPKTMMLFWGAKETGGHYMTISIDDNGNIFIHNDTKNETIERAYHFRENDLKKLSEFQQKAMPEKLLEYMQLSIAYPIDIGFEVISKTPVEE